MAVGKTGALSSAVPIAIGTFYEACPGLCWARVSPRLGLAKKLISS
jgi:hypothetical protein